ncbi:stage II sporulation protein R [Microaerobacter geothermalis]|uniref:stage II sporulation protein R n=1 Tax=Microaerobacter geothermalis TaxID=674972 RepID=UPI001F47A4E6|nr:stage II sporulation protein R [Microaerobacter geothermalis]MCF6093200.1 stage II sporulation protein R [Microaerobacter geothermalis]
MRKPLFYVLFILSVLVFSWESQLSAQSVAGGTIPDEAIRLRIIANSDSPEDQWLKRKIRDEIVQYLGRWANEVKDIEESRNLITSNMPEIKKIVRDTMNRYGYTYAADVTLGVVPFPTKMYGNQVYPAGDYEALRIVLGDGKGQNWWCVLFPPLCFIDIANGTSVEAPEMTNNGEELTQTRELTNDTEVEIRFFVADVIKKGMEWIEKNTN